MIQTADKLLQEVACAAEPERLTKKNKIELCQSITLLKKSCYVCF